MFGLFLTSPLGFRKNISILHLTFLVVVTILRTQRWIQLLKLATDTIKTRVNGRHAARVVIHVARRVAQLTLFPNTSLSRWKTSILYRMIDPSLTRWHCDKPQYTCPPCHAQNTRADTWVTCHWRQQPAAASPRSHANRSQRHPAVYEAHCNPEKLARC